MSAFHRCNDGAVAAIFGLLAVLVFLMIGSAIDYGRWAHARNQTLSAMDAAVLAGGRSLQTTGDVSTAIIAAQTFYEKNTKHRLPLKSDNIDFTVADDGLSVSATGNASIDTPFLSLANIDALAILDTSGTEYSKAEVAVGKNAGVNLEISMMLDVTGSMEGDSRIGALKTAAKDLIDIVVWDDQSTYTSRVALVPFSQSIRLPNVTARKAARGVTESTTTTNSGNTYWRTPCVAERLGSQAYTDAAPGPGAFVSTVYVDNDSRNCLPGNWGKVRPLSDNKTFLKNKIDALDTQGGTGGHLGTAWAWYTLSPNWNSLWSNAANHASAYNTPETQKIAILMTDGEYNTQYKKLNSNTAPSTTGTFVKSSGSNSASNGSSNSQARTMCTAMKAAGITVYAVGFGLENGSTASQTLAHCATDPSKFFDAQDAEGLRQAFRSIALKISSLYLSH